MTVQFGSTAIGGMQFNGVTIGEAMMDGQIVYQSKDTIVLSGTEFGESRGQLRTALDLYGADSSTVEYLPFNLDTSQATEMYGLFSFMSGLVTVPAMDTSNVTAMGDMFTSCSSLTSVPDLDTANVTDAVYMLNGCSSLTDGNIRLIGKHPSVSTGSMIEGSGLTREPFYDTAGNPI